MANPDQPKGASPRGELLRVRPYRSASALYPGDIVQMDSGGNVAVGSATGAALGVAVSYVSASGQDVMVADHPDQLFQIQADEADIDAQTDIFQNYGAVIGSPDTTYKRSTHELDSSVSGTTTYPLKVLGIVSDPKNALGANVLCIVKINNHQLNGGTGTADV